eukprot:ANDGO_02202.mRNA.1 hypothetical protein PHYSODRAFT_336245
MFVSETDFCVSLDAFGVVSIYRVIPPPSSLFLIARSNRGGPFVTTVCLVPTPLDVDPLQSERPLIAVTTRDSPHIVRLWSLAASPSPSSHPHSVSASGGTSSANLSSAGLSHDFPETTSLAIGSFVLEICATAAVLCVLTRDGLVVFQNGTFSLVAKYAVSRVSPCMSLSGDWIAFSDHITDADLADPSNSSLHSGFSGHSSSQSASGGKTVTQTVTDLSRHVSRHMQWLGRAAYKYYASQTSSGNADDSHFVTSQSHDDYGAGSGSAGTAQNPGVAGGEHAVEERELPEFSIGGMVRVRNVRSGKVVADIAVCPGQPIRHIAFDPSGTLLACAPYDGHQVYIYSFLHFAQAVVNNSGLSTTSLSAGGASSSSSSTGSGSSAAGNSTVLNPKLIFVCQRGVTDARIQDIAFDPTGRYVAVSSERTTHIYPITRMGVSAGPRSHCPLAALSSSQWALHGNASGMQPSAEIGDDDQSLHAVSAALMQPSSAYGLPSINSPNFMVGANASRLSAPIQLQPITRIRYAAAPDGSSAVEPRCLFLDPALWISVYGSSVLDNPAYVALATSSLAGTFHVRLFETLPTLSSTPMPGSNSVAMTGDGGIGDLGSGTGQTTTIGIQFVERKVNASSLLPTNSAIGSSGSSASSPIPPSPPMSSGVFGIHRLWCAVEKPPKVYPQPSNPRPRTPALEVQWLAQVELRTYRQNDPPPLWSNPLIKFKEINPRKPVSFGGSSAGRSQVWTVGDLAASVEISRSDPVPAPSADFANLFSANATSFGASNVSSAAQASSSPPNQYYYAAPENAELMGSIMLVPTAPVPDSSRVSSSEREDMVSRKVHRALETPFFAQNWNASQQQQQQHEQRQIHSHHSHHRQQQQQQQQQEPPQHQQPPVQLDFPGGVPRRVSFGPSQAQQCREDAILEHDLEDSMRQDARSLEQLEKPRSKGPLLDWSQTVVQPSSHPVPGQDSDILSDIGFTDSPTRTQNAPARSSGEAPEARRTLAFPSVPNQFNDPDADSFTDDENDDSEQQKKPAERRGRAEHKERVEQLPPIVKPTADDVRDLERTLGSLQVPSQEAEVASKDSPSNAQPGSSDSDKEKRSDSDEEVKSGGSGPTTQRKGSNGKKKKHRN